MSVVRRSMFRLVRWWCLSIIGLSLAANASAAESTNQIVFNRDIRPILSENCFHCHGPDKGNRKAKLRLDDRDVAIERGAIVPGKPEESELIKRINNSDPEEVMPPPDTHKSLKPAEKEALAKWIASGAEYQPHWAYITPKRPEVPAVTNAKWVANPIDAFILHSLEAKKLQPSREADKRTLLRRLSLDLIGLPPSPGEVDAFLKDHSPKAYERQVDRLLASPHFGERMAVPWLDAVRFSDTVGYHGDQNQRIFPYRDYVINSFNRNKSFDKFTIEQIAGDLLPNPTAEQIVATGFNRLNMMTREGGAQPKEYLAKYAADRVRTVSGAWLGSTMGCAECHDHKYDPFSAKDFYQMEAFFADLKQWGYYADAKYTPNPDLKGFGNEHPFPPEIEVDSPYLQKRQSELTSQLQTLIASTSAKMTPPQQKEFSSWYRETKAFLKQHTNGWFAPTPTVKAATNTIIKPDQTVVLYGKPIETEISLPLTNISLGAIRVELLPSEEHGGKIIRDTEGVNPDAPEDKPESTSISFTASLLAPGTTNTTALKFYDSEADQKEERYSNGAAIIGVTDMWKTSAEAYKTPQQAVWTLAQPTYVTNATLTLKFKPAKIGAIRVSLSRLSTPNPLDLNDGKTLAAAFKKARAPRRANGDLAAIYLWSTGWNKQTFEEGKKTQREIRECRNGRAWTMVSQSRGEPMTIRLLPRGNWQDDSGEIVQPAPPHFLPQPTNSAGRRLTRMDLARWLVSPENPLTARTIMNRTWKQFFGTGISAVVDDLGAQGEWPVHPELLDWLAVEFRESGWDVKHMVKLMVMSSTYRQDSNQTPGAREIDPANRLYSAQSPRRLDAEFVRDNALSISGLLNTDIGGPSAHPYQPAGYYANLQFPERDYFPDKDARQYRRGVYAHWQRTFLQPMLANFDAPAREESTCTRNLSNTPQQALTLLNDPTFVEAARVFATNVFNKKITTDEQRIDYIFQSALARPANAKEKLSLQKFVSDQRQHYAMHPHEVDKLFHVGLASAPSENLDKVEVAAWANVCRVVLNLHETITRY